MKGYTITLLLTGLLASMLPAVARANTRTWDGTTGNWTDAARWGGTVPQPGETGVVNSGSITLDATTADLAAFTMSGGTLTFANWDTALVATNVTITGGTLTMPAAFTDLQMSNRVHIVSSNFVLAAGALIDADGKGYVVANGPGKGDQSGSSNNGGGGYGGRGGDEGSGQGGDPYGSAEAPTDPGSGGGQYLSNADGNGGGAVLIVATNVTLNGTISANGQHGSTFNGGGSGGGVWIRCVQFAATGGVICATGGNGGSGYAGGGAGGGRIALDYETLAGTPSVRFSARAGAKYNRHAPGMGTLHLPDAGLLTDIGLSQNFDHVRILGDLGPLSLGSVSLTNAVSLGEQGVVLTTSGDLTVSDGGWLTLGGQALSDGLALGTDAAATNPIVNLGGKVTLDNGTLMLGGLGHGGVVAVSIDGALRLTNNATLTVYAGATNDVIEAGALLTVGGATVVGPDCWIYPHSHPTNGGSALFRLDNLTVVQSGGFNADAKGFHSDGLQGYGPGAGVSAGSRGGGGGYGGAGGRGANASSHGGGVYGVTNAPVDAGSAGGVGHDPTPGYGHGGGLIRIEAAQVMLDGTLTANGRGSVSQYGGGGSGGGIFVMCDSLQGRHNALLAAEGGAGGFHNTSGYLGGGGGGGRIVVAVGLTAQERADLVADHPISNLLTYSQHGGFRGDMAVSEGIGFSSATPAMPGTARFLAVLAEGSVALDVEGTPGGYGLPTPWDYGKHVGIVENSMLTNSVATPADTANGQRWVCLGWTLEDDVSNPVDSGTGTQAEFSMTTNLTLTWLWTNQYLLTVSSGEPAEGSVNATSVNGWYTNGVEVTGILAVASNDYTFAFWTGDVPAGRETDNPLTVIMDQARTLVANFASTSGVIKRWNGIGGWDEAGYWSPAGAPGPYDTAVIESGTVVLSAPRQAASVVVTNGAAILFTNWNARLTSGAMSVLSGGALTLPPGFTESQMSNRVHIVSSNFALAAGALIDADGKGYVVANGPGKGDQSGSNNNGGGGYGGRGGDEGSGQGGDPYGLAEAPTDPGSGGGQYLSNADGNGGGAVLIVATNVTLNGTISANGQHGSMYNGGGSGGGVWIRCVQFTATGGVIRVNGGDGGSGWGGGGAGGGRIALDYETLVGTSSVRFSARAGARYNRHAPGMGTLHLPDAGLLTDIGLSQNFDHVRILGDLGPLSLGSVSLTNAVSLGEQGVALTMSGDLTVLDGGWLTLGGQALSDGLTLGTDAAATNPIVNLGGKVTLDNGTLMLGGLGHGGVVAVSIDGVLRLTNSATLTVYAGATNDVIEAGALLTVGGATVVGPDCWIYPHSHPTNGGSALFRLDHLTVAQSGGFNADAKGFHSDGLQGYGPGAGVSAGSRGGGGGYGGAGGRGENASSHGGGVYGVTNAPIDAGSAGGVGHSPTPGYGHGGGLIRIEAAQVTLDGTLTANGRGSVSMYGGGGSGGGIFVMCDGFLGGNDALLSANGGAGGSTGGGGGGGRIAVWKDVPAHEQTMLLAGQEVARLRERITEEPFLRFTGTSLVDGGTGFQAGATGTIRFINGTFKGTMFMVR